MSFALSIYWNLKLSFLRIFQQLFITPIYFKYPRLFKLDLLFLKHYWNQNPYHLCRQYYLKNWGQHVLYGDTWPSVAYQFAKHLKIKPTDVIYELGSGTSRFAMWLQQISGCCVYAVEKVPVFQKIARQIKDTLSLPQFNPVEQDYHNIDLTGANLIYFYCTHLQPSQIFEIISRWTTLKKGARVITTSHSISDCGIKGYQLESTFRVSYPWGKCLVYVQKKLR